MALNNNRLPNDTATLVLGVVGIITGVIALIISKNAVALYKESPQEYKGYSNINAGRITAWIGIGIGSAILIFYAIYISMFGFAALDPEMIKELFNQQ